MAKFQLDIQEQKYEVEAPDETALPEIAETIAKNENVGTIRAPRFGEDFSTRLKRFGALEKKAIIGDIPFLRKRITEEQQKIEPYYGYEKIASPVMRVARDLALLKMLPAPAKATPIIKSAITGAGFGALTAGTEKLPEIAKSTAISSIIFPATELGISKIAQPFAKAAWKKAVQPFIENAFNFTSSISKEAIDYAIILLEFQFYLMLSRPA